VANVDYDEISQSQPAGLAPYPAKISSLDSGSRLSAERIADVST
jgi:hypothetical protein